MTESRSLRLWTVALWALWVVAATAGLGESRDHAQSTGSTPATVGVLSASTDAAVLPAKVADEVRVAAQGSPLRTMLVAAIVAVLIGLPTALRRRDTAAGPSHRPLRARRHTIALRAPPLPLAA